MLVLVCFVNMHLNTLQQCNGIYNFLSHLSLLVHSKFGLVNLLFFFFLQRVFLEGNPYLLVITMVVSIFHSIFDFLAFKNGNGNHLYLFYDELYGTWEILINLVFHALQIFSFGTKINQWKDFLRRRLS